MPARGPVREATFLAGPSRHAVPRVQRMPLGVLDVLARTFDESLARFCRFLEHPVRQRPFERNHGRARVEIAAAEVVVRVPRVGGEHEEAARPRRPARPQHEPRGGRVRVLLARAVQAHQVHPARPVGFGRDRHRHRPPAAVLHDGRRDLPRHGADPRRPPHDLGRPAVAHDLDIDRAGSGREQRDRISGEPALRPAVARRLHGQ